MCDQGNMDLPQRDGSYACVILGRAFMLDFFVVML